MTDELSRLAEAWRRQDEEDALPATERALRLARSRLLHRRILLTIVLGGVWAWLLLSVLIGYEGGWIVGQVLRLICVVSFPLWLLPLVRLLWRPAAFEPEHGLLQSELAAQRAMLRTLDRPIPQIALSVYAAFAALVLSARAVHGVASPAITALLLLLWLLLLAATWLFTIREHARAREAVTLLESLQPDDQGRQGRRTGRRPLPVWASLAGVAFLVAAAWPLQYLQASREWRAQIDERWGEDSGAAAIIAHRISRLDKRFPAPVTPDEAESLRQALSEPGRAYLRAMQTPASADLVDARIAWLDAAETALMGAERGPGALAERLAAAAPTSACLALPASERLAWLVEADAEADEALDCLLASLVSPDPHPPR